MAPKRKRQARKKKPVGSKAHQKKSRSSATSSAATSSAIAVDKPKPLSASNQAAIAKATAKKEKAAKKAAKAALEEPARMEKCLRMTDQLLTAKLPTSRTKLLGQRKKPPASSAKDAESSVGELVDVAPHLGRKGPARYGGKGRVVAVTGTGGSTLINVCYTAGGLERGIPVSRVTAYDYTVGGRQRRVMAGKRVPSLVSPRLVDRAPVSAPPFVVLSLFDTLREGNSRGRAKGWLRAALFGKDRPRTMSPAEKAKMIGHFREMEAFQAGAGKPKHTGRVKQRGQPSSGQWTKRKAKNPPALSMAYLCTAWGVGPNTPRRASDVRHTYFYGI
jgi:hypothetical protein